MWKQPEGRRDGRAGRRATGLLAVVLLGLGVGPARGELIYFKDGGRIQAPAKLEGETLVVQFGSTGVRLSRDGVRQVVPGFDPVAEWPTRWEAASSMTTNDRLSVVWWAVENGLVEQACQALRECRPKDPNDATLARLGLLVEALGRTPGLPSRFPEIEASLPTGLERTESVHFVLLHRVDSALAVERLQLLEQVFRAYYLSFAFQGLDLPLPREKLFSVLLPDRAAYVDFLTRQNAGAFRDTQGFYHPTLRLVVAWTAAGGSKPLLRPGRTFVEPRSLVAADRASAVELGTACHETIHQLVRASGLDGEPRRFPIWLHEGLAAQFEVVRGGRWAGISRAHDLRLADYRSTTAPPNLVPLLRDHGFGHGYRGDHYAAAWSLVYYLRRTHPDGLLAYLDLLRLPAGPLEGDSAVPTEVALSRALKLDLDAIEADWHRTMASCRTPLQEHDPDHRQP